VTWRARFGVLRAACFALPAMATGCVSSGVPDPRGAVDAYARAAERGDADALYGMMTTASRQARSREQVRAVVTDERAELAEQARGIAGKDVRVEATARLRFADGEEAALDLHDGRYWITAAGALPGGARTPEEALDQLRRVLARRSYAGLLRLLSPATRAAVENDLRALVDGLGEPATLPVQVTGDAAVVSVPGGHRVKLRREGGVWRIDDFD
jgi:hypothetical protein